MFFIKFRKFPSIPSLLRTFFYFHEWVLGFVNFFLHLLVWSYDHMILLLWPFDVLNYNNCFSNVQPGLHTCEVPHSHRNLTPGTPDPSTPLPPSPQTTICVSFWLVLPVTLVKKKQIHTYIFIFLPKGITLWCVKLIFPYRIPLAWKPVHIRT